MPQPSKRTPELVAQILARLAEGEPLAAICRSEGMPATRTVYDWRDADEDFAARFARAREDGFDQIALDAMDIADETMRDTLINDNGKPVPNSEWIARSRLRVDTRLKLLAKWDPKRYGERTQIATTDVEGNERPTEEVVATKIAALLALANERKAAGADLA